MLTRIGPFHSQGRGVGRSLELLALAKFVQASARSTTRLYGLVVGRGDNRTRPTAVNFTPAAATRADAEPCTLLAEGGCLGELPDALDPFLSHDHAPHVIAAFRANHMRGNRGAALRAKLQLARRLRVVSPAATGTGIGMFTLRYGHGTLNLGAR